MPANCFYYQGTIEQGAIISLKDSEHHHLHVVMRGKPGQIVDIINGKGTYAKAEILAIGKRETSLQVQESTTSSPRPTLGLAQALLSTQKLDFIVEKGTELGVTDFFFFPAKRSERDKFPKIERLQAVTISALKQSGRLFLPQITFLPDLSSLKEISAPLFFGDLTKRAPKLIDTFEKIGCFITGPEGGFNEEELEFLRKIARGVSLNTAILRAETASIAAIAIASQMT